MGKRGSWAAAACLAAGLAVLVQPPVQAADDYPYAGQGQCPILPQEPIEEPVPDQPEPGRPGPERAETPPPPPEPVLDPVSGHLYDPRGPRPTCARQVWAIDGSIGDPRGFALRNCTSFVAWRLAERNGMSDFSNRLGGVRWGDAGRWDDVARRLGFRVDHVPAIGAVAQTDEGRVGHVAWVTAIGRGTVTVEEYNYGQAGGYGTRTVPVGDFRYLHLDDVAPSPFVGSDRSIVSAADPRGRTWTARVDDRGTLLLAPPGRRARPDGPLRTFSPLAAPALTLSRAGRPWIAATTRDGRVLAGPVRAGRAALRDVGSGSTTASPAITMSRAGRPVVAVTAPTGTLTTRHFTRQRRWSRPQRVGRPGSWATHVAPVLGHDGADRTLLVAVRRRGRTYALPLEHGRLVRLPGAAGSITSTPALTRAGDGTTYVHQVAASGRLLVRTLHGRRWSRAREIGGSWSPYASPAVGDLAGESYVVAVDAAGRLRVRAALPGDRSALPGRVGRAGDPTRSPALVTRRDGGVFVVAGAGRTRSWLLARPASAVLEPTAPRRAGFTP